MQKTRDEFLTTDELADLLAVPVRTVYAWRHARTGPRGVRIGRHLRYRRTDVDAWLEERYADEDAAER